MEKQVIRSLAIAALSLLLPLAGLAAQGPTSSDAGGADQARPQSVGLVLSGGGSKGIAHIGVIKALEENNIPIDYITGTSMGAIIGGLYAAGYSPDEMLQLILSKPFGYWSTGQVDPSLVYYFATEEPTPAIAFKHLTTKRDSAQQARSAVPASLISPMPMGFAFMELFAGQTAQCQGDFDKLFVPFRCVASDAAAKHKVVLGSGSLGDAIRSSMSFPIVFQPTRVDSMLLYDGGIYDNFPVDVMKEEFAPDIIIGVDVSMPKKGPQTSLADQVETLVIQHSDYYLDPADGIKLKVNLNEFSLLDFPKAQQIYDIGYNHAMSMIDSIKGRVTSRVPEGEVARRRSAFKEQTPKIDFESVSVTGGTDKQNAYIKYLFTPEKGDTLSIDQARRSFYRAISPGKLRDLAPQADYNPSTGLFDLSLQASVKDRFKLGLGGYVTSSTSSYIYLSAGYSTLSFSSIASNVGVWLGQSYFAVQLNSRLYLRTRVPSALEFEGVASRQKHYENDYLFFEEKAPSYILDHQYFARLKWAVAVGSLCDMAFGVGYGSIRDSFYQPDKELGYLADRDRFKFDLAQAFVKFESNTLDDINFPVQGNYYMGNAMAVSGTYKQYPREGFDGDKSRPKWLQLELRTRNYFPIGRHFSVGVEGDVMLSTRKLLKDYNASLVAAPAFQPTPASHNSFDPAFRANSYLAVGASPIYRYNDNLSARVQGYCFLPLRKITQGPDNQAVHAKKWLADPEYYAELDICYRLPFATVTGYCNYSTGQSGDWNVGVSFGVFMQAPRFLR